MGFPTSFSFDLAVGFSERLDRIPAVDGFSGLEAFVEVSPGLDDCESVLALRGFCFFAGDAVAADALSSSTSIPTLRFFAEGGFVGLESAPSSDSEVAASFSAAVFSLASFFALYFAFMTFCLARLALIAVSFAFCRAS